MSLLSKLTRSIRQSLWRSSFILQKRHSHMWKLRRYRSDGGRSSLPPGTSLQRSPCLALSSLRASLKIVFRDFEQLCASAIGQAMLNAEAEPCRPGSSATRVLTIDLSIKSLLKKPLEILKICSWAGWVPMLPVSGLGSFHWEPNSSRLQDFATV